MDPGGRTVNLPVALDGFIRLCEGPHWCPHPAQKLAGAGGVSSLKNGEPAPLRRDSRLQHAGATGVVGVSAPQVVGLPVPMRTVWAPQAEGFHYSVAGFPILTYPIGV